jgi:hypothetical protein
VNLWDCLSHDVFKNLDLNYKKIHIQNAMTVSAGFNKKKAIQMYQKVCIYNVQSQLFFNKCTKINEGIKY